MPPTKRNVRAWHLPSARFVRQTTSNSSAQPSLVATATSWWSASHHTGTTLDDQIGNRDLTASGLNESAFTNDGTYQFVNLVGADWLEAADDDALDPVAEDFTVVVVFQPYSLASTQILAAKRQGAGDGWTLYTEAGVLSGVHDVSSGVTATGATLVVDTIYTLAAVRDGTSWRVVVDGTAGTSQTVSGSMANTLGMRVNRGSGSTALYSNGWFYGMAWFKGLALTDAETAEVGAELLAQASQLDPPDSNPLTTPTYDGSGQATHPSVIDFGTTWNGHRYWMAMTPYPYADSDYENPSILVSSDGLTWSVPAGLTNPIDAHPGGDEYNADVELVYDAGQDQLLCYYLGFDGTNKTTHLRTSDDGVTWTAEQTLFSTVWTTLNDVSPTVILDGSTWKMWTIETVDSPNPLLLRTASAPEGPWSAPTACTINRVTNRDLWHLDVVKHGSTYHMAVVDCTRNVLGDENNEIYVATSSDGETWTLDPTPILSPAPSAPLPGWASQRLYRPTLLVDDTGMRVWYGAVSTDNEWRIGYYQDF